MAKAAKSDSAKKQAPAKKASPAKGVSQGGGGLIDTDLAAQNAARLLVANLKKRGAASQSTEPQSAMFKNLKANLSQGAGASIANVLEQSHGPEVTKSHEAFNKQVGHNQTVGSDAVRTGVPRRTPG